MKRRNSNVKEICPKTGKVLRETWAQVQIVEPLSKHIIYVDEDDKREDSLQVKDFCKKVLTERNK